jgi:hypothetical protein
MGAFQWISSRQVSGMLILAREAMIEQRSCRSDAAGSKG